MDVSRGHDGRAQRSLATLGRGRAEETARAIDEHDYPVERSIYALRNVTALHQQATGAGEAVGRFAAALLDGPLPCRKREWLHEVKVWDKIEALKTLAKHFGLLVDRVEVSLLGWMLRRRTA